ncbi:hypothetical protein [Nocardioides korecus]
MKIKPWEAAVLVVTVGFLVVFKAWRFSSKTPPAFMWVGLVVLMLLCFFVAALHGRGRSSHSNPPRSRDDSSDDPGPPAQSGGRDGGERPGG